MEIFFEIHKDLPKESPGGDEYTRQAYGMLPLLSQPTILDIGCGPGAQTLELARLIDGKIVAIDTHQPFLDRLKAAAAVSGLIDRITCLNRSMFDLSFPDKTFDVLWAEGSIYIMGFERGLKQWRPLVKSGGYVVASELVWLQQHPPKIIQEFWQQNYPGMRTVEQLLNLIPECGYDIVGHFTLPEQAWWNYYQPLAARIDRQRELYGNGSEALTVLENEQREIEMYREYHDYYGYQFFALQKSVKPK
ncbi:MAG: methyltransferase domain-containing protein [Hormoscilla sp. SP5CHS1]|nr:methyltransferase domain-containing protein [Hormoscilla sp. SP12CHS1]MBC6453228.1 methyltransferase domain-containing protein [Hormoscilla sp. SP5CHS1]MBC6476330.1 methyltransferase domain-containing protein [Hormoscilla sp. GM102CHS1]